MDRERIVAVGLLTQRDVTLLGPTFDRIWPVEELRAQDAAGEQGSEAFEELLRAIDEADEALTHESR